MKIFLPFLLILIINKISFGNSNDNEKEQTRNEMDHTTAPPPQGQGGRSFFLFGGFFRKFRQRWHGEPEPIPLYAGPAFPIAGYYNCPIYGCDPALTYRPAPYEPINYYNRPPYQYNPMQHPYGPTVSQPQQQHTQQSNVVIYQNGQQQQQQPNGQQGYYNQNNHQPYPVPAGNSQYYPNPPPLPAPPPPPPLPPPPPPAPHPFPYAQNFPPGNGASGFYQPNNQQYPVNNYGNYPPPMPLPPTAPQNFDPNYNQPPLTPLGHGGPLPAYPAPIGPPPCPPHIYSCHGGG